MAVGEPNFTDGALTLDVDDVDAAVERVKEAGGSLVRERGAIPGVGWFAHVGDTEGNVFGLMEADESAR